MIVEQFGESGGISTQRVAGIIQKLGLMHRDRGCEGGGNNATHSSDELSGKHCIKNVWESNLAKEFEVIRKLVSQYPVIAMDTEFPGLVIKKKNDCSNYSNESESVYDVLRGNVDMLNIIQLGLTLMNAKGERPAGISTWQFNFKFDEEKDHFSEESVSFLKRCGIQFERHKEDGFTGDEFAYYLLSSNLILSDEITWITFHGCYDFGYLLKIMKNSLLPNTVEEFLENIGFYFPRVFDVKFLMSSVQLPGGLQDVADQLEVKRIGQAHQAGSDSLLTGLVFFRMQTVWFGNRINEKVYNHQIFGLQRE